jgi:acyl dehydratase
LNGSQPQHYFEELLLGGEWTTRRRTISEADIAVFNGLAGDYSPLVADAQYAASSHFGGRVASGALLVAAAMGLGSMDAPPIHSAGLVGMSWRFLKPVRAGDTIHTVWRLARKRPVENPRWGLAVWQVAVRNQDDQACAEGEVARLVIRREQPAPPSGGGRRRRRRRPAAEAPAPEPAPADIPSPARRRRRRGGGGEAKEPETAPEAVPTPVTPARRRRRRRGNGSRATNGGGESTAPVPADVQSAPPAPATPEGGIGSVLRRIRRRR